MTYQVSQEILRKLLEQQAEEEKKKKAEFQNIPMGEAQKIELPEEDELKKRLKKMVK